MLKKTGIVVATAAAGMIALTPLAFAGESHGDWHKDRGHKVEKTDYDFEYNLDNSVSRNQSNECSFGQSQGISSSLLGVVPLLDAGPVAVPAPGGPITQTQTQDANCTNVGDAL